MSSQGVRHFVSLSHLAEALSERWYQLTQVRDIEESIALSKEALCLHMCHDERRAIMLGNLAQALMYRSFPNAEESRPSSAISLLREALSITPLHNDVFVILRTRLCLALIRHYDTLGGTISDLQEAVEVSRSTIDLLPVGHRYRPEVVVFLSYALHRRDDREPGTEAQNHTEETRLLLYRTLDMQSPTYPRRAWCLSALGCLLAAAYDLGRGSKSDLDEGIKLIQEAMTLVTPSHITFSFILDKLTLGLTLRFLHFHQNREDLDYSITLQEHLMNARAFSDGNRYNHVHNLASALEVRYKYFHDPADLHRAIALGREALVLCPPGHPNHQHSVRMLSERLILDPHCLITHIDEMVGLLEAVLQDEYKPEASLLNKSLFEAAVQDQSSGFGFRFQAAKQWVSAAESLDSPIMAMKAYRMAIHISPYRIYPGLDLSSQLDHLRRDFATISCDAACCALVAAGTSEALTLFEQGRATFWAQRLQLRMSFDALPSDLAERLCSATKKLQEYHLLKRAHNASGEQRLLEQRVHYEAFQQLMREARLYADFNDFLRPMSIEQLSDVAEKGPVIVLLSSKRYGSFAIIIRSRSPQVERLPLSSVTIDDLEKMVKELQISVRWARQEIRDATSEGYERLKLAKGKLGPKMVPDAMARLWSTVGEPIMRHLGIEVSAQPPKSLTRPATQTVFSDARHSTLGHEYGGAAPALLLRCLSMQLGWKDPVLYICQITSSHHMHRPSAVLSRQGKTRLLQQRLK
jgi:hypothetical protein